jgi:hypothetical protein
MDQRLTGEQLDELWGHPVWSRDGQLLGSLEDVFPEHGGHRPRWLGIGTGALAGRLALVPIEGAYIAADGVAVAHTRDVVELAPELYESNLDDATARELRVYWAAVQSSERAAS